MSLSTNLKELLISKGATEVGFANLKEIENVPSDMPNGISIPIKLSKEAIKSIDVKGKKEYLKEYDNSYPILDELALKGEEFLKNKGYKAYALTKERVSVPDNKITLIPFKTVATRSGLGWIGKSALFITPKYGSAVRLITILTNAPLDFNKPITASLCGMCRICQDNCPADAITGLTWNPKLERNDLFEYKKCLNVLEELAENEFHNPNVKVCSKCISVCPNTQRYVEK